MRKFMFLALGILSCSATAVRAQEPAAADLSVGYSYLREALSNGINANGGSVALPRYANHPLRNTGHLPAQHASAVRTRANNCTHLLRARLCDRDSSRDTPLPHAL